MMVALERSRMMRSDGCREALIRRLKSRKPLIRRKQKNNMDSVEIYEFKFDSKTEDLLKQLSEDDASERSVFFEEIEFTEEKESILTEDDISTDTDYDSLDEEQESIEDELTKMCKLDSPWNYYAKRELIGTGSSCRVYRAVNVMTKQEVAVKQMVLSRQRSKQLTLNEICALKHIKSDKIIPLHDVFYSHCPLEDSMVVSVVLKLCPMSLSKLIQSTVMNESAIATILASILEGLQMLHSNNIAHRDIKSENVLMSDSGDVYLSDLGYCDLVEPNGQCPVIGMVGTPHWMAPEVVNFGTTSLSSDIWSLGIVALEMIQGKAPLMATHTAQQAVTTIGNYRRGPVYNKSRLSSELNHFLQRCFVVDPAKRATVEELIETNFIQELTKNKPVDLSRQVSIAKLIQSSKGR